MTPDLAGGGGVAALASVLSASSLATLPGPYGAGKLCLCGCPGGRGVGLREALVHQGKLCLCGCPGPERHNSACGSRSVRERDLRNNPDEPFLEDVRAYLFGDLISSLGSRHIEHGFFGGHCAFSQPEAQYGHANQHNPERTHDRRSGRQIQLERCIDARR